MTKNDKTTKDQPRAVQERMASTPTPRRPLVTRLTRGDRIRVSGFLYELLQDVDAMLVEEEQQ